MSKSKDKTQQVIDSILLIRDHQSDGLGDCLCSHCCQAEKIIKSNLEESEAVAKLLAKSESK